MKKSLLKSVALCSIIAASLVSSVSADAQRKVYLNSYNGTKMEKYSGKKMDVYISRQMFTGWNTICLPFSMTTEEVNKVFGSDCKLETLTDVNVNGQSVVVNFCDVKNEGIIAGKPYLLYYTGETGSVSLDLEGKELTATMLPISMNGVTFTGTQSHVEAEGHYGILARDNMEARFVATDNSLSGFYATRCYIDYVNGTSASITTLHNQTATSIKSVSVADSNEPIYNLNGQKVDGLQKGVNIIQGKKILVK